MNLFEEYQSDEDLNNNNISKIEGLEILYNFITDVEEQNLINLIDKGTWLNDLKRRVQHYGYKYDYRARKLDHSYYLGDLPVWLKEIVNQLNLKYHINLDQAIINEYEPGQGISSHIDCEPCFGDIVITLSLGSDAVMNFVRGEQKHSVFLKRRSIGIMRGSSRYDWHHGIPSRKTDVFNQMKRKRKRRLSITFREVII